MPIYEYQCGACGQVTEDMWSVADKPDEIACPSCGEVAKSIVSIITIGDPAEYGGHARMTPNMERTYMIHKQWYDKPENRAKIKSGEMTFNTPRGTPSHVQPEALKEKTV